MLLLLALLGLVIFGVVCLYVGITILLDEFTKPLG